MEFQLYAGLLKITIANKSFQDKVEIFLKQLESSKVKAKKLHPVPKSFVVISMVFGTELS